MQRLLVAALISLTVSAHAAGWEESREVGEIFADAGVEGTFVLYDVAADTLVGYNGERARTRFVPASTFKIPHTLIALSVGAVRSVDEVLPYGGRPQPFKAWEKDMALREAISLSNVAIYQGVAWRIGLQRMRRSVSRMGFGNKHIGRKVDDFWLVGPLKISAIEQTQFLGTLAQDALPFPREHQQSVREIVRLEQGENWVLYGKTGWENAPGPGVGWWVGWVQKDGRVYAFALNIDIATPADASKRVDLGKASLKALEVL